MGASGQRPRKGWKRCNRRHQVQAGSTADRLDRAVETRERQGARREVEEQLGDRFPRCGLVGCSCPTDANDARRRGEGTSRS